MALRPEVNQVLARGRPDSSMDLLSQIFAQPLDPDYVRRDGRPPSPRRAAVVIFCCLLLSGLMIGVSIAQNARSAPLVEQERSQLRERIFAQQELIAEQNARVTALDAEVEQARAEVLSGDSRSAELEAELERLGLAAQTVAVRGPGLVITVDDGPQGADGTANQVLDSDLQQMANGLWSAGAEAIAINGHRLGPGTAIRIAGDAITVDYRSLSRPYRMEAIGDPDTLRSGWEQGAGAELWNHLRDDYGLRYEMADSAELELPAGRQQQLHAAEVGE
ncbi:DUF881 domain-containing protein [Naumannella halotolerans]|uniref:DUF881 domain-containing protein n=1 Tax=Naumannella halotolerans TaxID=993414 RepID=UPI00141505CA|nr:DUF881 domain-containing protein [Naumannella halotolerans]